MRLTLLGESPSKRAFIDLSTLEIYEGNGFYREVTEVYRKYLLSNHKLPKGFEYLEAAIVVLPYIAIPSGYLEGLYSRHIIRAYIRGLLLGKYAFEELKKNKILKEIALIDEVSHTFIFRVTGPEAYVYAGLIAYKDNKNSNGRLFLDEEFVQRVLENNENYRIPIPGINTYVGNYLSTRLLKLKEQLIE